MLPYITLQGTNISHLGKRKIIFKSDFWWDILVPRRVPIWIKGCTSHIRCVHIYMHILCVCDRRTDKIFLMASTPILRECQLACTLGTMYYVPPQKKSKNFAKWHTTSIESVSSWGHDAIVLESFCHISCEQDQPWRSVQDTQNPWSKHWVFLHVTQPDYGVSRWCNANSSKQK